MTFFYAFLYDYLIMNKMDDKAWKVARLPIIGKKTIALKNQIFEINYRLVKIFKITLMTLTLVRKCAIALQHTIASKLRHCPTNTVIFYFIFS